MLSSRNSFLLPMDSDWVFNRKTVVNHFHPTTDECLNHGIHRHIIVSLKRSISHIRTRTFPKFLLHYQVSYRRVSSSGNPKQACNCGKTSVSLALSGFEDVTMTPRRAQSRIHRNMHHQVSK